MKLKNSNFHLGTCCREKVSGASEWNLSGSNSSVRELGEDFSFPGVIVKRVQKEMR